LLCGLTARTPPLAAVVVVTLIVNRDNYCVGKYSARTNVRGAERRTHSDMIK